MYMYVCILKCTSIYIYMLQVLDISRNLYKSPRMFQSSYHNVFLPLPTHDVHDFPCM